MKNIAKIDDTLIAAKDSVNLRKTAIELFEAKEENAREYWGVGETKVTHIYYTLDWNKTELNGEHGRMGDMIGLRYEDDSYTLFVKGHVYEVPAEMLLIMSIMEES